jgi:hypothetical protein
VHSLPSSRWRGVISSSSEIPDDVHGSVHSWLRRLIRRRGSQYADERPEAERPCAAQTHLAWPGQTQTPESHGVAETRERTDRAQGHTDRQ